MSKKKKNEARRGPKTPHLDFEQLEIFCRLKPSLQDCADMFRVHFNTIQNVIFEKTGKTFSEFRDSQMVHTKFGLIQKAISKANDGDNDMLKFALKNLCDWKDSPKDKTDITIYSNLLTDEQLDRKIKELLKD